MGIAPRLSTAAATFALAALAAFESGLAPSEIPESVNKRCERILACEAAVTVGELGR